MTLISFSSSKEITEIDLKPGRYTDEDLCKPFHGTMWNCKVITVLPKGQGKILTFQPKDEFDRSKHPNMSEQELLSRVQKKRQETYPGVDPTPLWSYLTNYTDSTGSARDLALTYANNVIENLPKAFITFYNLKLCTKESKRILWDTQLKNILNLPQAQLKDWNYLAIRDMDLPDTLEGIKRNLESLRNELCYLVTYDPSYRKSFEKALENITVFHQLKFSAGIDQSGSLVLNIPDRDALDYAQKEYHIKDPSYPIIPTEKSLGIEPDASFARKQLRARVISTKELLHDATLHFANTVLMILQEEKADRIWALQNEFKRVQKLCDPYLDRIEADKTEMDKLLKIEMISSKQYEIAAKQRDIATVSIAYAIDLWSNKTSLSGARELLNEKSLYIDHLNIFWEDPDELRFFHKRFNRPYDTNERRKAVEKFCYRALIHRLSR